MASTKSVSGEKRTKRADEESITDDLSFKEKRGRFEGLDGLDILAELSADTSLKSYSTTVTSSSDVGIVGGGSAVASSSSSTLLKSEELDSSKFIHFDIPSCELSLFKKKLIEYETVFEITLVECLHQVIELHDSYFKKTSSDVTATFVFLRSNIAYLNSMLTNWKNIFENFRLVPSGRKVITFTEISPSFNSMNQSSFKEDNTNIKFYTPFVNFEKRTKSLLDFTIHNIICLQSINSKLDFKLIETNEISKLKLLAILRHIHMYIIRLLDFSNQMRENFYKFFV